MMAIAIPSSALAGIEKFCRNFHRNEKRSPEFSVAGSCPQIAGINLGIMGLMFCFVYDFR